MLDHPPPETPDHDPHPFWLVPALSAGVVALALWSAEPLARAWWARWSEAPVDYVLDTRFESPLPRPTTSGRPLVFPVYGDAQVVWGIDHLRVFPLPDPAIPGEGPTCLAPALRPQRVWSGWPHQGSDAHLMVANTHRGYDIAALQGAPVLAAHDGMAIVTVRRGRCSAATSKGHVNSKGERARRWDWVDEVQVVDWWSRLELTSSYHNLEQVLVRSGDRVKAGEMIGTVGKTGCATWPHLIGVRIAAA